MPRLNNSLLTAIKPKAKNNVRTTAILLFYILQKYYLNKWGTFFHDRLSEFFKDSDVSGGIVAPASYTRAVATL
jgi:hypothetical protein